MQNVCCLYLGLYTLKWNTLFEYFRLINQQNIISLLLMHNNIEFNVCLVYHPPLNYIWKSFPCTRKRIRRHSNSFSKNLRNPRVPGFTFPEIYAQWSKPFSREIPHTYIYIYIYESDLRFHVYTFYVDFVLTWNMGVPRPWKLTALTLARHWPGKKTHPRVVFRPLKSRGWFL